MHAAMLLRFGRVSFLSFLLGFCLVDPAVAENWPAWRGPLGTGVCLEKNLPLHWSTNENVRWRVPLPERGNSTPIVWGQRVFVTQAIEQDGRRTLLCFDRADGKRLWQQGPTYPEKELTHETNPQSSSSPVTDGERVIAWFGSAGLFCYDKSGRELWHRDLGPQRHIWGSGSSPVLHGNLCVLNFGPGAWPLSNRRAARSSGLVRVSTRSPTPPRSLTAKKKLWWPWSVSMGWRS